MTVDELIAALQQQPSDAEVRYTSVLVAQGEREDLETERRVDLVKLVSRDTLAPVPGRTRRQRQPRPVVLLW